jgi:hypothetical protein
MLLKAINAIVLMIVMLLVNVAPAWAGAVGGPKAGDYRLNANSYRTFSVGFRANEVARIALKGDGDTDLDLFVYDELGNLVASDDDYSDLCVVEWTPRWTGNFTIKIVNHGTVYSDFTIRTN